MNEQSKTVNDSRRKVIGSLSGAATLAASTPLMVSCGSADTAEPVANIPSAREKSASAILAQESGGNGQIVSINGLAPFPKAFSNGGGSWVDTNGSFGIKRLANGGLKGSQAGSLSSAMINTNVSIGITHKVVVDSLPA
jgi:hypothetical protein